VKEKLLMAFRRLVLFARNVAGKFGKAVKEKFLMPSRRFVPFAQNVGRNREKDNKGELRHQFAWPHVMNSSLAMHGPPVSRHHGYYRTRR
jgi:hypothetical protein